MSDRIKCTGNCGVGYHIAGTVSANQCGKNVISSPATSIPAHMVDAPKLSKSGRVLSDDPHYVFRKYKSSPGSLNDRHDKAAAEYGEFTDEQIAFGLHFATKIDPGQSDEETLHAEYDKLIEQWDRGYRPVKPFQAARYKGGQGFTTDPIDGYDNGKNFVNVYSVDTATDDDGETEYILNVQGGRHVVSKDEILMIRHTAPSQYHQARHFDDYDLEPFRGYSY